MGAGVAFTLTIPWLQASFPDLTYITPLKQGGQKLVFSAKHATDGDVVFKLVRPSTSAEEIAREILAVTKVQSPRVPAIFGNGKVATPVGDCVWIREQRIDGASVRDILGGGALNPKETLRLGLHTLEALVKAQEVDIVHRDVKPDNLMRDVAGSFWLLDFGLSRHLSLDSLTATAQPFGKVTWGYSPPEQCRNLKPAIDSRADLFALGVTLFECGIGSNPFRARAPDALLMLHDVETMPLPELMLPIAAQREFRDLVAAMTQKRPYHRPLDAAEALEWMQEVCAAEGI